MITVEPPNNDKLVQEVLSSIRRFPLLGGYTIYGYVTSTVFNETIMTSNAQDELNQYIHVAMVFENRLTTTN